MNTRTASPFRRTCIYCGLKSEAQKPEWSNNRVRFMDTRGRIANHQEKTVDSMPAYIINALHERDCDKRPA